MYKYKMDPLLPEMNLYGNYSYLDSGFNDPSFIESLSLSHTSSIVNDDLLPEMISSSADKASKGRKSPPKHRHDGTSPLPLGMDWSPSPRVWDGHDTIWPHDSHTGWIYCATIPSWTISLRPRGSATVVFYRVQIGLRSPDGFTTTREILRRFSDFLKLSSKLKKEFPKKKLPPAPSKELLRMQSHELLEERRCLLEDWMMKVLSDIELSRSASIGIFLELEAAARSSFYELNQNVADVHSSISVAPSIQFLNSSDVSLLAGSSSIASDCGNDSAYGTPELGSPMEGMSQFHERDNAAIYQGFTHSEEVISEDAGMKHRDSKPMKDSEQGNQENHLKMPSTGSEIDVSTKRVTESVHVKWTLEPDISTELISDISNLLKLEPLRNTSQDHAEGADLQVVIQLDGQNKLNRILSTMQLRLATAKTDIEDLLSRLNQELTVKQYLATKHHEEIVEYFKRRGVSAIFLFRRNLLRRMVSILANSYDQNAKLLNGTHKSHVHSPKEAEILASYKPRINTTTLIANLKQIQGMTANALEYFKSTRHMILFYEDIIKNQTMLNDVQDFLRVPRMDLHSRQVKIHKAPLSLQVENWSDVEKALKGTPYESFLHADYKI